MIPRIKGGRLLPDETKDPEYKTERQLANMYSKKSQAMMAATKKQQLEMVERIKKERLK